MSQPTDTRRGPAGSNKARPWEGFVYGGLFLLLVAGLTSLVIYQVWPKILDGQLIYPDNYMRLVRVNNLVATGDWFDSTIPRSNAPFGEVLHWTRPLDVLILAGTLLLRPFLPFPEALHWAGVFLPPVLLFLTGLAAAWASRPLTGNHLQLLAMIGVVVQVGILQATLPGRPDHHALHALLTVVTLGWSVRWILRPFSWRTAVATGTAAGTGLWVGTEFLVMDALLLLAGVVFWIREGEAWTRKNLWFSLGFWGIVSLAWVLENPPAQWLMAQYDKVSVPHALMALLVVVYWVGLSRLFERERLGPSEGTAPGQEALQGRPDAETQDARTGMRVLAAGLAGALALAALWAVFPSFFLGPEADIDPQLSPIWRRFVIEDQPFFNAGGQDLAGNVLLYLGSPLICLPYLVRCLISEKREARWNVWLLFTLMLAAFLPLGLFRFRFVAYPEIAAIPVLAVLLSRAASGFQSIPIPLLRTLLRGTTTSILICGPLLLGAGMMGAGEGGAPATTDAPGSSISDASGSSDGDSPGSCPITSMARTLDTLQAGGRAARIIAAHLGYGPEILYRTPHRVIGTPYHRNSEGILSLFFILAGSPEMAREEVVRRGVDWVLVCGEQSWIYSGEVLEEGTTNVRGPPQVQGDPPLEGQPPVPGDPPVQGEPLEQTGGAARGGRPTPSGAPKPLSLHNGLLAGEIPGWLEPIPLEDPALGDFLLFRVRTEEPGESTPTFPDSVGER